MELVIERVGASNPDGGSNAWSPGVAVNCNWVGRDDPSLPATATLCSWTRHFTHDCLSPTRSTKRGEYGNTPWKTTMTDKWNQWPSVPSSSTVTTQGSGKHNNGAEGAKNLWVRTGCQWKLKICTYNARSLSSDDRLHELEDKLDRINFDIVGVCEIRGKGEGCLTLNKSGHQFYYKGGNTHQNGISFIVNKNIASNVTSFKGISDRVAQLTIKIIWQVRNTVQ